WPDRMLPATVGDPTYYLPKVEHGRLTGILLRRGWLVLVLTALGMAAMVWMASGKPKMFRSSGSVYVSTQAPRILDIPAVSPEESRDLEQMRSVEQGLSATTLLARVVEKNGLSEDPAFAIPGEGQEALLRRFSERVEIGLRRGTRIIDLAVEDTDPARAKRLVESLVSEYEAWTTERQQAI